MSEINPFHVEHVTADITQEISADHRLVIFDVANSGSATMSHWVDQVKGVLTDWPADTPCLLLHDLHRSGSSFELYMTEKFPELYVFRPHLSRQVAFVMPHAFSEDQTKEVESETELAVRCRELESHQKYPVRWELFHDRRSALKWILLPSSS